MTNGFQLLELGSHLVIAREGATRIHWLDIQNTVESFKFRATNSTENELASQIPKRILRLLGTDIDKGQ